MLKVKNGNVIKILHILYKENGIIVDYCANNYSDLYTLNVKDFRFIVGLNLHQSSSNYS